MATLYHWDLPAALDDRGGWLNPDIADWFADYASVVFKALDDRIKLWATLNEPWVVTDGGYLHGVLAPGHRNLLRGADRVAPPDARARAKRCRRIAREGRHADRAGRQHRAEVPGSRTSEADLAATERAHAYMNRQYLDPVLLGRYPERDARDLRRGLARVAGRRTWS